MGTLTQNQHIPETFHLEDEAYRKLLPGLLEKYRTEFVAIHDGKLADHDVDPFVLGKRVRENFGTKFVLIRAVDPSCTRAESCFLLAKQI